MTPILPAAASDEAIRADLEAQLAAKDRTIAELMEEKREMALQSLADIDQWISQVGGLNARVKELEAQISDARGEREWRPMETAPRNQTILAAVDDSPRFVRWGKTSHVPLYGWCLADQGPEDFDLCKPSGWMPLPSVPTISKEEDRGTK